MKKLLSSLVLAGLLLASAGCGSKPSAEELKQLEDLKNEVTSIERDISARESEKTSLAKSIADKDAQLAQCAKDKDAVEKAIKGSQ
jgi:septal ring factor EnvC (AmiA/AmiB activator)